MNEKIHHFANNLNSYAPSKCRIFLPFHWFFGVSNSHYLFMFSSNLYLRKSKLIIYLCLDIFVTLARGWTNNCICSISLYRFYVISFAVCRSSWECWTKSDFKVLSPESNKGITLSYGFTTFVHQLYYYIPYGENHIFETFRRRFFSK